MGPLDEGSIHELDDESLFTPDGEAYKTHSLHSPHHHIASFVGGPREFSIKFWRNCVLRSIKIVVFTTKLNLLMPFGPLAILVHVLTGHNVSFSHIHDF